VFLQDCGSAAIFRFVMRRIPMLKTLAIAAGLAIGVSGVAMAQTTVVVTCPDGYALANGSCQPIAAPGGVVGGAVGAAGAIAGGAVNTAGAIAGGTINAVTGNPPPPPYR
jgi:hypothetical protein